ncbi:14968_t:CDS:1, partial [Gigaspora rosea]
GAYRFYDSLSTVFPKPAPTELVVRGLCSTTTGITCHHRSPTTSKPYEYGNGK